jgi:hypothetical protein
MSRSPWGRRSAIEAHPQGTSSAARKRSPAASWSWKRSLRPVQLRRWVVPWQGTLTVTSGTGVQEGMGAGS